MTTTFRHRAVAVLLLASAAAVAGCGSKEPAAADVIVTDVAPTPPPPAPHPTTEEGVLTAFTQALEQKDLAAVRRFLAPELGAELTRQAEKAPDDFWGRSGEWVANAKTGISITARDDQAAKGDRWNALVHFGNGQEERVTFARVDGKLVLSDL